MIGYWGWHEMSWWFARGLLETFWGKFRLGIRMLVGFLPLQNVFVGGDMVWYGMV